MWTSLLLFSWACISYFLTEFNVNKAFLNLTLITKTKEKIYQFFKNLILRIIKKRVWTGLLKTLFNVKKYYLYMRIND
jgi:hypothetical protein